MQSSAPIFWRLIATPAADGPTNMALDEALLNSYESGASSPILRIYGWNPPALSVGRFQDVKVTVDVEECKRNGVQIVRRVTGGGAIYHADEMTYSIVCSQEHIPSAASVKDSFRVLTCFILDFYRTLGLDARYAVDADNGLDKAFGVRTPFCFAGRESFDILIDGRKIGGNAQRRNRNIIFQHGSVPVVNHSRDGLQYMQDRSSSHAEKTTSLAECGIFEGQVELNTILTECFQQRMEGELLPSGLSPAEVTAMGRLLERYYTDDSWNLKGVRV